MHLKALFILAVTAMAMPTTRNSPSESPLQSNGDQDVSLSDLMIAKWNQEYQVDKAQVEADRKAALEREAEKVRVAAEKEDRRLNTLLVESAQSGMIKIITELGNFYPDRQWDPRVVQQAIEGALKGLEKTKSMQALPRGLVGGDLQAYKAHWIAKYEGILEKLQQLIDASDDDKEPFDRQSAADGVLNAMLVHAVRKGDADAIQQLQMDYPDRQWNPEVIESAQEEAKNAIAVTEATAELPRGMGGTLEGYKAHWISKFVSVLDALESLTDQQAENDA